MFRKATTADAAQILEILDYGRLRLKDSDIPQWQEGYPNHETVDADIAAEQSYVWDEKGNILGVTVFSENPEPTYNVIENGEWLTNGNYHVVHRMATSADSVGKGVSKKMFTSMIELLIGKNRSIRVDTHEKNIPMRNLLESFGFKHCGVIYVWGNQPRYAYELVVIS